MTTSYPAVGLFGMNEQQWMTMFGARDGIIEDYLGTAFSMTLLNATNEAQFTAAKINVNGYVLDVSDGDKVSLPAPTTGSKTYYIGALYDPVLNVPDSSGNAAPLGPCRLAVYDTTIDTSNGKRFLIAYVVTRTSAALTAATVQDRRRWIGDICMDFADPPGMVDALPGNEGSYPRGTLRVANRRFLLRTLNDAGTLGWVDPLLSGPFPFPAPSGLVSRDAAPSAPQYLRYAGSFVKCRGTLKRANNTNLSTGSNVILGTLPVGYRPAFGERFICRVSSGYTEVNVGSGGVVTMVDPATPCTWIDLSPINFRAE